MYPEEFDYEEAPRSYTGETSMGINCDIEIDEVFMCLYKHISFFNLDAYIRCARYWHQSSLSNLSAEKIKFSWTIVEVVLDKSLTKTTSYSACASLS